MSSAATTPNTTAIDSKKPLTQQELITANIKLLIEQLEAELGSAEIFTALFELELAGRVRQLPGKNYVRAF